MVEPREVDESLTAMAAPIPVEVELANEAPSKLTLQEASALTAAPLNPSKSANYVSEMAAFVQPEQLIPRPLPSGFELPAKVDPPPTVSEPSFTDTKL